MTETREETVRIPSGCLGIQLVSAFGGGYVIRFTGQSGILIGSVTAPVSVTFHPDGTLTYPIPFADPEPEGLQ